MKNFKKLLILTCLLLVCNTAISSYQIASRPEIISWTKSAMCPLGSRATFESKVKGSPSPILEIRYDNGHFIDWSIYVPDYNGHLIPK